MEALLEAWRINARLSTYLLSAIEPEALATPLAKGRAVGDQFAHIHNVRLMWAKASAPDLLPGTIKLEKGADRQSILESLDASALIVEEILRRAENPDGRVKGFKPHAAAFAAYLIAHEACHRGHVELALRQAGSPVSDKVSYGLWEWGSR